MAGRGAVFCRPLKRALGDSGFVGPQAYSWGYHLTPAHAGFNAGLLTRAPLRIGAGTAASGSGGASLSDQYGIGGLVWRGGTVAGRLASRCGVKSTTPKTSGFAAIPARTNETRITAFTVELTTNDTGLGDAARKGSLGRACHRKDRLRG
jgi:hypothetical protein